MPHVSVAVWKENSVLYINIGSIQSIKTDKLYTKTYLLPNKHPKRKPKKVLSCKEHKFDASVNVSSLLYELQEPQY